MTRLVTLGIALVLAAGIGLWEKGAILSPWLYEWKLRVMTAQAVQKARDRGVSVPPGTPVRLAKGPFGLGTGFPYEPPRGYQTRSCYHALINAPPDKLVECNAQRCIFNNGQSCEQTTHRCYDKDGSLILDQEGNLVTDVESYLFVRWQMCLAADGTPLPPLGERPYDERYQTGCSYRVAYAEDRLSKNSPIYNLFSLVNCDQYRCVFPGGSFYNRVTKRFDNGTKTPTFGEFADINWMCLDVNRLKIKPADLCGNIGELGEGEPSACKLCYENKRHVYKDCVYTYNEQGERGARRLNFTAEYLAQRERYQKVIDPAIYRESASLLKRLTTLKVELLILNVPAATQDKIAQAIDQFVTKVETASLTGKRLDAELEKFEKEFRGIRRAFQKQM